jgi:gamma-glutamylcysteine synthetase
LFVQRDRGEQPLQLFEPRFGGVIALEPGRTFELDNDRVEGAVLMYGEQK